MMKLNNCMKNYIFIIFAFLLGFATTSFAQESPENNMFWAEKPVECYPMQEVWQHAQEAGLQAAFGGLGILDYQVEDGLEKDEGFIFLLVNLQTGVFAVVEVDKQQIACLVAKGNGSEFDPETLSKMTTPASPAIETQKYSN